MEHAPRGNQLRLTGSACINKVIILLLSIVLRFYGRSLALLATKTFGVSLIVYVQYPHAFHDDEHLAQVNLQQHDRWKESLTKKPHVQTTYESHVILV